MPGLNTDNWLNTGGASGSGNTPGTWSDSNGYVRTGTPPAQNAPVANLPWAGQTVNGQYVPLQPTGNASDMAAGLLASQMADWQKTYMPVEQNLLQESSLNNPNVLVNAVNDASASTNQTYDAMAGVEKRKLAAQGIAPTAEQSQVSDRVRSLSRAASLAGAQNTARQNVATEDQLIALGSAPNPNVVQGSANAKYAA